MDDELYEKGIAIREEMLGPEHGRAKVESQPDPARVGRVHSAQDLHQRALARAVLPGQGVDLTRAQRAGQADRIAGPDARGRPRPRGGVDEVRRTAPVAGTEGTRRGQRRDPVRQRHAHRLGHSGIV